MNRTRTALLAALAAAALALPGCIIVDGTHSGSAYKGHGAMDKAQFDTMVAANTQNRIGEDSATVLARFPADHISLVHTDASPAGERIVYRVYARERDRSTRFERYLVFENDRLTLLTDDRDDITHLDHD